MGEITGIRKNQDLITYLEELLKLAKSGDLTEMIVLLNVNAEIDIEVVADDIDVFSIVGYLDYFKTQLILEVTDE